MNQPSPSKNLVTLVGPAGTECFREEDVPRMLGMGYRRKGQPAPDAPSFRPAITDAGRMRKPPVEPKDDRPED